MSHAFLPLLASALVHAHCVAVSGTPPPLTPARWPRHYEVTGTHSEPMYVEPVRLERAGNDFLLIGGAPLGDRPLRISVHVDADGSIRGADRQGGTLVCRNAAAMPCDLPLRGFLASAAVIAARRHGITPRVLERREFAGRCLACVDAAAIAAAATINAAAARPGPLEPPLVDPCLDERTGAVLAFRHRMSGQFEGPTLDAGSIHIAVSGMVTSRSPGAGRP